MLKITFRVVAISFIIFCLLYPFIWHAPKKVSTGSELIPPVEPYIEEPLHNVILPDFAQMHDVKTKKTAFFNLLLPVVKAENQRITNERAKIDNALTDIELDIQLELQQIDDVKTILSRYKLPTEISESNLLVALNRIDRLPIHLVLSQAANESGWGTSRFTRIGLNFFGQWCYKKGCGLVPKSRSINGQHEVAAFRTIEQGVASYFLNVNTHPAYQDLRDIRQEHREMDSVTLATHLAAGLTRYSERGQAYVDEISEMIISNQRYISE